MQKMKYFLLSAILFASSALVGCNKSSVEIMVVGVNTTMCPEINLLIDNLNNKKTKTIDNLRFYTGSIAGKSVVIAETPFGMPESAMTTTIGIKHFHPKYVINEGTSGGHVDSEKHHQKDIILGRKIINLASYHGDPKDPEHWNLLKDPLYSDEKLLEIASNVKYSNDITPGIISSSESWNTDKEFITELHKLFHEDCEEMESYSVANVCNNYQIPFLAVRVISNNLLIKGEEEYSKEAAIECQNYVINLIKAIS